MILIYNMRAETRWQRDDLLTSAGHTHFRRYRFFITWHTSVKDHESTVSIGLRITKKLTSRQIFKDGIHA